MIGAWCAALTLICGYDLVSVSDVVDHCGGHQGLKGTCPAAGDTDPVQKAAWESGIAELASLPNAIAKISGLYGG